MRAGTSSAIPQGILVPGTQQVLRKCLLIDRKATGGADKNLSFHRLSPGPARWYPALKTQSLESFPGRVSAQGTFSSGGGHHSSGLSPVRGRGWRSPAGPQLLLPAPCSRSRLPLCAVLILIGVGLEVAPSPGECPLRPPQAALARSSCAGWGRVLGEPRLSQPRILLALSPQKVRLAQAVQ